jgi:hypothetical protein
VAAVTDRERPGPREVIVQEDMEDQGASEEMRRDRPSSRSDLRSGWLRPLVIIAILAVMFVAVRLAIMLFTM